MEALLSLAFLAAIVRGAMPLALASLGGLFSERGGVINIALEGLMVTGAFGGACGAYYGHGALAGIVVGVLAATLVALLYAVVVIRFGADQIVVGVAFNLLAIGLSRYLLKLVFGSAANAKDLTAVHDVFASSTLGQLAKNPLVLGTIAIMFGAHALLYRTRFGLRLRAAGDHPEAAAALGVDVVRTRYLALALSGALAGLAGVWMVVALETYSSGMIGGRGYIALAALIFGGWRPLPALGASILFGFFQALAVQLRLIPAVLGRIPEGYLILAPYALTILALVLLRARHRPPAALGRPFEG